MDCLYVTRVSVQFKKINLPTNRTALRMKELKLQPAALMLASPPPPSFLRDRQQNRMASPIIICQHNNSPVTSAHRGGDTQKIQTINLCQSGSDIISQFENMNGNWLLYVSNVPQLVLWIPLKALG